MFRICIFGNTNYFKHHAYTTSFPASTKAEKQGREDKFDAITRKFMYTALGVTKTLPDGKVILKNIDMCFYPGAKIGVIGLNERGKSALLKIMAGEDVGGFDDTAVPMPGISIGYLCQEPTLEGKTVMDNINLGVKKSQDYIDRYTELSTKLSENLDQDETDRVMAELADVESKIDSGNLWELERVKTRAMDALRCPPPNANVDVLSGKLLLLKRCTRNLTTNYLSCNLTITIVQQVHFLSVSLLIYFLNARGLNLSSF